MKILMALISALAHFETDGTPHPIRFMLAGEEIKIEHRRLNDRGKARR